MWKKKRWLRILNSYLFFLNKNSWASGSSRGKLFGRSFQMRQPGAIGLKASEELCCYTEEQKSLSLFFFFNVLQGSDSIDMVIYVYNL